MGSLELAITILDVKKKAKLKNKNLKKTPKEIDRINEMKSPVSKPPFQWKKKGEIHWALLIPNNIAFVIQTIIFLILTIIGIIVSPL